MKYIHLLMLIFVGLLFLSPYVIAAETTINDDDLDSQENSIVTYLTASRWSPYIVGTGIGLLSWLSFLLSGKAIGVSTAYVRSCGMIQKIFQPKKVEENAYYQKFTPKIDWEWMLVIGLVIGAFVSAITSGDFKFEVIPSIWVNAVGNNGSGRLLVAFIGGLILAIGARWAGGCTSGHGISGTLQLVISSWIAAVCFFVGGIITAMLVYKVIY
jgi:uncharacterized membrane protein YedE/YeeE